MNTLGDRIKELRTSAGMTQTEFGALFGIVKSTVSLYENNKSTPDDSIKMEICKHFNVSMDYLLGTPPPTILGTELDTMIHELADELEEPYEKLVDIFLNQKISNNLTKHNLKYFFLSFLNDEKFEHDRDTLSPKQKDLLSAANSLSDDDLSKVIEYIEFLQTKQQKNNG